MIDPSQTASKAVYKRPGKFLSLCADLPRRRLYAGSTDYSIQVFDLAAEKKEPVAELTRHENYVSAVALIDRQSSTPWMISGSYDRRLIWWDLEAVATLREVEAHAGWIRNLVVIPGSPLVASCGDDMLVKLWDAESGQLVRTLAGHALRTPQGHVTALYALAASSDGKWLASGDRIGEVRVWEVETGKLAATFQVPVLYTYDDRQRKRSIGGIRSLAFSPDGNWIAAGGIGQINNVDGLEGPATLELWDWRAGKQLFATGAQKHKAIINQLQFWPDSSWLLGVGGGGDNGLLCFWKAELPSEESKKDKKDDPVPLHKVKADGHLHCLVLNPAASEIYTAGHERLDVWSVE